MENLDLLVRNGEATIPDAVLIELNEVEDGLYQWCHNREDYFYTQTNDDIQELVRIISNGYPNLRRAGTPSRNFADPIVIAMAEYFNCAIITHENATGNINGPRIPDVCRARNIRVMQVHHMVSEQGWTFR